MVLIAGTILAIPRVHAQGVDGGSLLNQMQKERPPAPQPSPPLVPGTSPKQPQAPAASGNGGAVVLVKEFQFEGNTKISSAALAESLQAHVGSRLSLSQLQDLPQKVADVYGQQGWLARVVLPAQDVTEGVIRFLVIEARLGQYRLEGDAQRVNREWLHRRLSAQMTPGDWLQTGRLQAALLAADELPGVEVTAQLVPGEQDGQTDVVLALKDERLFQGKLTADNSGSRSTGEERVVFSGSLNGPLGFGDQASLMTVKTRGSEVARVAYDWPVGAAGWRIGVNTSAMRYRIVGQTGLGGEGESSVHGARGSYPLMRSPEHRLDWSMTADHKNFLNLSPGGTVNTDYRVDVIGLAIEGAWFRPNWVLSYGATLNSGNVDLDGSPNQLADAREIKTDGRFHKLGFNAFSNYTLSTEWSLEAVGQVQLASKNLDSSEKFYLGGANGVRAYLVSESSGAQGPLLGSGSQGALIKVDLRYRVNSELSFAAFVDHGRVQQYKSALSSNAGPNVYGLSARGLSANWGQSGYSLSLTWAQPIGSDPFRSAAVAAKDGTSRSNQLWLSTQFSL